MAVREMRYIGRSPLRSGWKPVAAAGAVIFLAIAAPSGIDAFGKFFRDVPSILRSPQKMLTEKMEERHPGKKFRIKSSRHLCTVDCGGRGSFTEGLENRGVLEVDFSGEGVYRKEFYLSDRGLPLVMEGVGDDKDRYFIRYRKEGAGIVQERVQHTKNRGDGWKAGEEFGNEDARAIWNEALRRFSPERE